MSVISSRELSGLMVISMVVIGSLGLAGILPPSPRLGAILLVTAIILGVVLGRWTADFW
jgi:L-cystine uptake protein TcyP (sodium:dicarboxylate symporter family)